MEINNDPKEKPQVKPLIEVRCAATNSAFLGICNYLRLAYFRNIKNIFPIFPTRNFHDKNHRGAPINRAVYTVKHRNLRFSNNFGTKIKSKHY